MYFGQAEGLGEKSFMKRESELEVEDEKGSVSRRTDSWSKDKQCEFFKDLARKA